MTSWFTSALNRQNAGVVFYGTSLTKSGGWAETLTRELAGHFPGLRATNAAENGQHSRWGLENLETRVLAHEPDLLFLEFAINDAVARFELSPTEARANLEAMLDQLATRRPECVVVLQVMNPVVGRPPGHDGHRPHLPVYEQVYRDVAAKRGLLLVDHAPAWATLLKRGEPEFLRYVPDGLHPNAAGYDRFMFPTLRHALGLLPP